MPYIKEDYRNDLDAAINDLASRLAHFPEYEIEGALNYTITSLLDNIKPLRSDWRYKYINRVLGTLEAVKLEFYRRLAGPYEDKAITKNGDLPIYKI